MLSESELQKKIIELIKKEEFLSSINGAERIEKVLNKDNNENFLPGYQIDFQLNTKYSQSAKSVLDALSLTELITGDRIKNIPLQKDTKNNKERLYPDIVLINEEL